MDGIRPIDIVILLALRNAKPSERGRAVSWLASELAVSTKIPHDSLKRLGALRLVYDDLGVVAAALVPFIEAAARYSFPATPGRVVGGVPTASSAPPLDTIFSPVSGELAYVWPDADGGMRGSSIEPLHRSVPNLARRDPEFYADIALVDALRLQDVRIRREAQQQLRIRMLAEG